MKIYRRKTIFKQQKMPKFWFNMLRLSISWWNVLKNYNFLYIHSYLINSDITWANTRIAKSKPLLYKQKQVLCIVFNESPLSHSNPLFRISNPSNVYMINLYLHLNFMYRLRKRDITAIFNSIVKKSEHKYPTNFSSLNYILSKYSSNNFC